MATKKTAKRKSTKTRAKKTTTAADEKPAAKSRTKTTKKAAKKTAKKTTRSKSTTRKRTNKAADEAVEVVEDAAPKKSAAKTAKKKTTKSRKKSDAPSARDKKSEAKKSKRGSSKNGFAKLGLHDDILAALADANFETPSDIQRELIPHALAGKDCIGQARTGTGKTAAFALPLLEMVEHGNGLQALVLVPTRELAKQVDDHVQMLGAQRGLQTALAYGGVRITEQQKRLDAGAEILVGTPGRILDIQGRRLVNFDKLTHVVLDEVDRMLDIGFRDDIRRILRSINQKHQTIFVSATISDEIRKLAMKFMNDPVEINVSQDELTVDKINHGYVTVERSDKMSTLLRFMKEANPKLAIVFTNMKVTARRVSQKLERAGIRCVEIHGDLMQKKREKMLEKFRGAHVQVMVATDLASRGLDVMEVSHIVNYDIPEDSAVYVHRIGRTARMGKSGYAVTFVQPDEGKLLTEIELLINREIPNFEEAWAPPRQVKPEPIQEETPAEPEQPKTSERYLEPVSRCAILESHGIKPLKRTLGSRFRPPRKHK